ncbi:MAG: FlgB family protein [Rhodosalinus sp.]|uniref:FlgB family protein n=1 Tax=Rhodosalinus sp. TaxID=2047741 RepID=UPI00397CA87E
MFDRLNVFSTAQAMAMHAGTRHAVLARNMAHADTPGFRPADLAPFRETVSRQAPAARLRGTRPGHFTMAASTVPTPQLREEILSDPNGNGVSLELEMLKAVEAKRQHDRAMTIYRSALEIMRQSIGRR